MRPFSTLVMALGLGGLVCLASPASAELIWQDNFDTQPLGTALGALTPPIGNSYVASGTVGTVEDATTYPAPATGATSQFATIPHLAGSTLQIRYDQAGVDTTGQMVRTSMDVWIEGGSNRVYLYTVGGGGGGAGQSFELALFGTGGIGPGNGKILSSPGDVLRGDIPVNQWFHVQVDADYTAHTYTASVGANTWSASFINPGNIQGRLELAGIATAGSAFTSYFDNSRVEIVPEPSSIAMIVTGLVGLLASRRGKRGWTVRIG